MTLSFVLSAIVMTKCPKCGSHNSNSERPCHACNTGRGAFPSFQDSGPLPSVDKVPQDGRPNNDPPPPCQH